MGRPRLDRRPRREGFLGSRVFARFRWAVEDAKETGEFTFQVFEGLEGPYTFPGTSTKLCSRRWRSLRSRNWTFNGGK